LENKRLKVSYAKQPESNTPNVNVYFSHLEPAITSEILQQMCAPYGSIEEAKALTDPRTGLPRGIGFVRFSNQAQAQAAIAALNGTNTGSYFFLSLFVQSLRRLLFAGSTTTAGGRPMLVKFADSKDDRTRKMRSKLMATMPGA
jgi:RNA recognition motif-containing protein